MRLVQCQRPPPDVALAALMSTECPDCDADYVLRDTEHDPLGWIVEIRHDETCPFLRGDTG